MQVDRSVKSRLCWSQFKTAIKRVYWQESRQAWDNKAKKFSQPTIPRVDGWAYFLF